MEVVSNTKLGKIVTSGVSKKKIEKLKKQIEKSIDDPNYTIVSSFEWKLVEE